MKTKKAGKEKTVTITAKATDGTDKKAKINVQRSLDITTVFQYVIHNAGDWKAVWYAE